MGLYNAGLGLGGSFGLTPAPSKALYAGNYLSFDSATGGGTFLQQFLPDVYEQEVERYGNRSVSSFLRMVGAEEPSTSDQIIWSEQGRLHLAYKGVGFASTTSTEKVLNITGHAIRLYQTVAISNGLFTEKAIVSAIATNTVTVQPYKTANFSASLLATTGINVFVYGSEWGKGSDVPSNYGTVDAGFVEYSNRPIVLRDQYSISGSDASQIGWVEVTTENGASGYLWYLKSEHEARLRFEDYLEMAMVEGEKVVASSGASGITLNGGAAPQGTEGMFAAIEARGNVYQNFGSGEATLSNAGADRTSLADFDEILKNLDKQGAIEENMIFMNRTMSLAFDNMLAGVSVNSVGLGTSYGVFDNSSDMALNLGFSGFRRGSYDFYKTDWKYLNDAATRGLTSDIAGVLVPAGTSTVYDQQLGKNLKRPFLHVRYRASDADDRKMKTWITGSVGGATNSTLDKMQVNFLSERCLVVQGANNFVLFKQVTQTA